ncbi:Cro/CI family transcriptional regulator [Acinetobacter towneri]|uniref:Ribonuclease D n=1 Tax=Acinetobacter towneri TaxID=202956 RepID=A0AB35LXS8_9GAMM|nr:Cro/CI family transcriptional regulator [Acinetobacter towneri]MDM1718063.1 ribonuclease D [Acinetobacter towneri]MDM1734694.1 ribonuclease D [Acinetobacter towneri]MDM1738033.1 ribonuclease D [Acinetobacter towneri]MDM1741805.1 ribonuclease D [Acinetobacter towneri]MDM1745249.1 ribonuclease D [Acinetobacter towneri]
MTRDEAIKLLGCSLSELAGLLGITTAAVAKWDKNRIPPLREYQVKELASRKASKNNEQNLVQSTN